MLITLLLSLAACGRPPGANGETTEAETSETTEGGETTTAETTGGTTPEAPVSETVFALVGAGEEAGRQTYRYAIPDGTTWGLTVQSGTSRSLSVDGGEEQEQPPSPLRFDLQLGPTSTSGDIIEIPVEVRNAQLELPPGLTPDMLNERSRAQFDAAQEQLSVLVGRTTRFRVSTTGVDEEEVADGTDMMAQVKSFLPVIFPRLPEEPIGIGAEWTVTQQLSQGGSTVTATSRYGLAQDETGDGLTISEEMEVGASEGQTQEANGVSQTLESMEGRGIRLVRLSLEGTGGAAQRQMQTRLRLRQTQEGEAHQVAITTIERTQVAPTAEIEAIRAEAAAAAAGSAAPAEDPEAAEPATTGGDTLGAEEMPEQE